MSDWEHNISLTGRTLGGASSKTDKVSSVATDHAESTWCYARMRFAVRAKRGRNLQRPMNLETGRSAMGDDECGNRYSRNEQADTGAD